jgi:hypothetical protein
LEAAGRQRCNPDLVPSDAGSAGGGPGQEADLRARGPARRRSRRRCSNFEKGDLDLLSLSAKKVSGGTEFEAVFARPIKVPGRESVDDLGTSLNSVARYGFYTFNLDIYIDTDRQPESGLPGTLPGREAQMRPGNYWERIVCLTPLPNEASARLRRLVVDMMKERQREETGQSPDREWIQQLKKSIPDDMEERVFFPKRIRVRGRSIKFFVPDNFLRGTADPSWGYVVAVTGSDLLQSVDMSAAAYLGREYKERFFALPIAPGSWQNIFGGGREKEELQPPIVDLIVPQGERQESVLSDYSSMQDRPAVLPAVVPAEE